MSMTVCFNIKVVDNMMLVFVSGTVPSDVVNSSQQGMNLFEYCY